MGGKRAFADILLIWARNTDTKKLQCFIVHRTSPGLTTSVIKRKVCMRILQNGMISLIDVFVPDTDVLPGAQDFLSGTNAALLSARVGVAWAPVGVIAGVYEHSVQYLRNRLQFGVPLAAMQINQEKLARIMAIFQASFMQAMRLIQLGERVTIGLASLVKGWNSLMGREASRLGRELMGGNGLLIENYVGKAMMDMEGAYTGEGTYDINVLVSGRDLTGVSAFKPSYKP